MPTCNHGVNCRRCGLRLAFRFRFVCRGFFSGRFLHLCQGRFCATFSAPKVQPAQDVRLPLSECHKAAAHVPLCTHKNNRYGASWAFLIFPLSFETSVPGFWDDPPSRCPCTRWAPDPVINGVKWAPYKWPKINRFAWGEHHPTYRSYMELFHPIPKGSNHLLRMVMEPKYHAFRR